MTRFRFRILPLWLAAGTLLSACGDSPDQAAAAPAPPPPQVGVVELQPQRVVLTMDLPARASAFRIAEVRPQVSGILQKRLFEQGAPVEAGDVLYQIDPSRYRAANQKAQADLEGAQADLRQAEREWKRTSRMYERNAVSERERDQALSALEIARADVASARAMLESSRIDLDYTEVKAPISGRTGPTLFTVGALVTANQAQPLSRVVQLDPIYADIQIPAEKLDRIRGSQAAGNSGVAQVQLLRKDGRVYPHPGRLDVTDVTVDPGTSAVTLRAVVPNPDSELLPGMYLRVRLQESVRENAILAPQQGVARNPQGEATVLLVNDEGKVEQRRVQVERTVGKFWLVGDGLEPGDRLIVSGLQKIRPGAAVKPVKADIPRSPSSLSGHGGDAESQPGDAASSAPRGGDGS